MTIKPSDFLPKDRDAAIEMIAEALYSIFDSIRQNQPREAYDKLNALLDMIERS
jgi:hypothetical protein